MSADSYEPTPAQIEAADRLRDAGLAAEKAERAWGRALDALHEAVKAAKTAGIPKTDIKPLATVRTLHGLGGSTSEKLRVMIRKTYP